jgi:hypothetical protein
MRVIVTNENCIHKEVKKTFMKLIDLWNVILYSLVGCVYM